MPTAKKKQKPTWRDKLHRDDGFPKVVPIGPSMTSQWGNGTMVIPAPREVDEIMKRIPTGKLITITEIRAVLARRHGATIGCPMTTGIFAWIAANAAEEGGRRGTGDDGTPYWRTLKTGGYLNEKYPGGVENQKARLESEGHRVEQRGKRYAVAGYELALALDEVED